MQDALKAAIEVPLNVVRVGNSCWPHLITLAQHGNISTKSDLQVTVITNVAINSPLHPCEPCDLSVSSMSVCAPLCIVCTRWQRTVSGQAWEELHATWTSTLQSCQMRTTRRRCGKMLSVVTCLVLNLTGPLHQHQVYSCFFTHHFSHPAQLLIKTPILLQFHYRWKEKWRKLCRLPTTVVRKCWQHWMKDSCMHCYSLWDCMQQKRFVDTASTI